MNEADLIGYLLGALDSAEESAVEAHLSHTAEAQCRLNQLRLSLLPLEADREPGLPPTGLAERTIARLASHLEESDPLGIERIVLAETINTVPAEAPVPRAPREEPEIRSLGGRFRADFVVAATIAFIALGLVFTSIGKVRARSQVVYCQANLQTLYFGLVGYAETHEGRYPAIGSDSTADSFATTLADAGQVPVGFRPACPASIETDNQKPLRYTYTLGFQTPNGLLTGLRRPEGGEEHDLLPISADYPTESASPVAGSLCDHPPQMNVLYLGGQVRVTTSPLIGPNGDDIYRNMHGFVAAGIDHNDVVLGRPGDRP